MKFKLLILMLACYAIGFSQTQPVAPVKVVTDEYFGVKIDDPYQYLEDMKDPDVEQWFKGQGDYSRTVLDRINGRDQLIAKFKELDSRRSSRIFNLSITENDYYFYEKMTPEDEVGKLFMRKGYDGEEYLLFDPSIYKSEEGVQYTIGSIAPSFDASHVGFSLAPNGSESSTILVINVEDKKMLDEEINTTWGYMSWQKDNSSFIYGKLNSDDVTDEKRQLDTKVYVHQLGHDPSHDSMVFSGAMFPDLGITSEEIPWIVYDKDSDKIFCYASTVDRNQKVYMADSNSLNSDKTKWTKIISREDLIEDMFTDKSHFYIKTSREASNYKILKTPLDKPDFINAEVLIAESPDEVLQEFVITKKGFYYTRIKNGIEAKVYHMSADGKTNKELDLPFTSGRASLAIKGIHHDDLWVSISGWTNDNRRFRYLADRDKFQLETMSTIAEYPEFEDLVAEEVMVTSHDGVKVPLSIVYMKGMKKDGQTPLMLYGYGSYGASINPFFSPMFLTWISEGGMLAIAHVRGGGELGETWHKAGYKETKPNTWKDFIACAEYLHKEKYSSPEKTAMFGGSAGGILIGKAMTDRPDLFAVAVPAVGVLNALRTELEPNGPVNVPEFGTFKIESEFKALVEMDAYLSLKQGVKYPSTLVTAGMNDPRVIAWQPGKFAARLQAVNGSDNPILFRVDYESGHGSDAKSKTFEEFGDIFSFSFWQTGHTDYQAIKQTDKNVAE